MSLEPPELERMVRATVLKLTELREDHLRHAGVLRSLPGLEDKLVELEGHLSDLGNEIAELKRLQLAARARSEQLQNLGAAALIDQIRRDPALQELLRGRVGPAGLNGDPGPKGDNAATVIREVKILG